MMQFKYNILLDNIPAYSPSSRGEKDLIKLDWNECVIPLSKTEKEIVDKSILNIDNTYYPNIKNNYLLELLSCYTGLPEDNICFFNGSDSALKHIFDCFVDHKTNVLLFNPDYTQVDVFAYHRTPRITKSNIFDIFGANKYDFNLIKHHDVLYLSYPNNPIGCLVDRSLIEYHIALHPNVLFIIDEAYYEYSESTCVELVKKHKNIIVTRTFSKAFPLTNARFGYLCADKSIIAKINKIKNCKEVNGFSQSIATSVLENIELFSRRISIVKENKKYFCDKLSRSGVSFSESFGNFVFLKHKNHNAILDKLKHKHGILVRSRSDLYTDSFRVTIGQKPHLDKVLQVIQNEN